jgi:hypothetical protein
MAIDYMQMLRRLAEEREEWVRKRDDAMRELSRLSELIRSTIKMLSPEQRSKCDALLERIDRRPAGLTTTIRLCFTAGKEWLTPVEIRDMLKANGFNFESYKANPLASIHTTLKRMVPHEVACKTVNGQKVYRLKAAEQWSAALAEAREWLADKECVAIGRGPWMFAEQLGRRSAEVQLERAIARKKINHPKDSER